MTHPHILVVDDDADFAESTAELLEREGYKIHISTSGQQAIADYQQQKYDMVLLDIKMPGLNGVETYMALKKLDEDVKAVLMTAFTNHDLRKKALVAGIIDILDKPVDYKQIVDIIEYVTSNIEILIIDDDYDFVMGLKTNIESHGHKVLFAHNNKDAMNLMCSKTHQKIKLLLLDIRLNENNGFDILNEMKLKGLKIPTIIITGYADEYNEQLCECVSGDVIEVIKKPFDPDVLIQKITSIDIQANL